MSAMKNHKYVLYQYKEEHPEDVFEYMGCVETTSELYDNHETELREVIAELHCCSPFYVTFKHTFTSLVDLKNYLLKHKMKDLKVKHLNFERNLFSIPNMN